MHTTTLSRLSLRVARWNLAVCIKMCRISCTGLLPSYGINPSLKESGHLCESHWKNSEIGCSQGPIRFPVTTEEQEKSQKKRNIRCIF
jgi:hypothetical protein